MRRQPKPLTIKSVLVLPEYWNMGVGVLLIDEVARRMQDKGKDHPMWTNFNFLVGSWQGTGSGQPGSSKVERTYQFILNGKFIEAKNKSTYPPQDQNPQGEVHEDVGLISYDKGRKTFVLRQFHIEGFVNQYVCDTLAPDSRTIVFTTESIENIPPGWRARETYQVISPDEFTETFELAEPGKDFEVYTRNHFLRTAGT